MPYEIKKEDDRYCVYKDDGECMRCHDSESAATAQMHALYAVDAKEIVKLTQEECNFAPISPALDSGIVCKTCRWFDRDYCQIVKGVPVAITEISWCNRHEPPPDMDADTEPYEPVEDEPVELEIEADMYEERSVGQSLLDHFRSWLKSAPDANAFQVHGDRWFARWTNNFKDREGEWFSEKAIDAYIRRVDMGIIPLPDLWVYHVPGSKIGQTDMIGRIGHIVVATGTFEDTPRGKAAQRYFTRRKARMSHGFVFNPVRFIDGVYYDFNTFELTVLPSKAAANPYTTFEGVLDMPLSEDKREFLAKVFGPDIAQQIEADTEQASKALEEAGVAYKDYADISDDASETRAVKEATERADDNFAALLPDIISDIADLAEMQAAAGKAHTANANAVDTLRAEVKSALDTLRAEVRDMIAAELALAPRASQSNATVVKDAETRKQVEERATETNPTFNPFPGVK